MICTKGWNTILVLLMIVLISSYCLWQSSKDNESMVIDEVIDEAMEEVEEVTEVEKVDTPTEVEAPSVVEKKVEETVTTPQPAKTNAPQKLKNESQATITPTKVNTSTNTKTFTVTAYCPCKKCCGKTDGITATGVRAKAGRTIAVDPRVIPYGTKIYFEGYGTFVAEDCGGAIKGNRIDMYFDSHQEALKFGRRTLKGVILR